VVDVSRKRFCVDRTVKHPGRIDPVMAQGSDKGHGIPIPVRRKPLQPLAFLCPATQGRHVGLGPGFVDEDQTVWLNPTLIAFPPGSKPRDVGALLLDRQRGFF